MLHHVYFCLLHCVISLHPALHVTRLFCLSSFIVARVAIFDSTKDWRFCWAKFDFRFRSCQFVSVLVCITIVLFVDAMLLQSSFFVRFPIVFAELYCECVCLGVRVVRLRKKKHFGKINNDVWWETIKTLIHIRRFI